MTENRYEKVVKKWWERDDGLKASIFSSCPWTSPMEEERWEIKTNGYSIKDNEKGKIYGKPYPPYFYTSVEADKIVAEKNK